MQMHIVGKRRIAEQSENKHAAIGRLLWEERDVCILSDCLGYNSSNADSDCTSVVLTL